MKKFLVSFYLAIISLGSYAFDNSDISEKVLQAFNKTFPQARQVVWTELENTYEVSFLQDDLPSRVTYDKEGEIINITRYYFQKDLPSIILVSVQEKYPGKTISGITEFSADGATDYYITLTDANGGLVIKSDISGNLRVDHRFKK